MISKFNYKAILKAMFLDKLISASEAKRIDLNIKQSMTADVSPLVAIARNLPTHLITQKKINLEQLCEWFAEQCDLDYYHIDPLNIDIDSVSQIVSPEYANKNGLLAIKSTNDSVTIAVKNPFDLNWKDSLSRLLRKDIAVVIANPNDIDRYASEFFNLAKSISQSRISDESTGVTIQQNLEQLVDLARTGQLDAEDHHIVQVVDWLLQYAFEQRASDIHLEPRKERGEIRFRIDGVLHYATTCLPMLCWRSLVALKH